MLSGTDLTITFDKNLVVQPIAASNWVLHLDPSGTLAPVTAMVVGATPTEVELNFSLAAEALSIEYLGTPPDVVGAPPPPGGLDVVAFIWPLA